MEGTMFSGIIEKTAKISSVSRSGDSSVLRLHTGFTGLELGESVAVNGICLTVAEITGKSGAADEEVSFFVSPETLARTSLRSALPGTLVNLERAMQMGQRISGHIVQGHVDGQASCTRLEEQSGAWLLEFKLPRELARYTIEKGSIAIDGVSLTVNNCIGEDRIRIMLIPHTWTHTRFSQIKVGDLVNIEVDSVAKYIEKYTEKYVTALCGKQEQS